MQAGRKYSLYQTLYWSRKYILAFILIDSIPVIAFQIFDIKWLILPWQPISLIGIAVSFYLGFKNNSSYERLWEARKIWGGIVNESRTLTVKVRDFITSRHADISDEELKKIHKEIVHRHVAWLKAFTYQMREPREWEHHNKRYDKQRWDGDVHHETDHFEKIKPYLSEEDYNYISKKGNKASHLLSLQSKTFNELRDKNLIDDFRHIDLENQIGKLYTLQGKSERIKNFPFPRQYASMNQFFVWIFILLLPFGMMNVFDEYLDYHYNWLTIPFTVLVSWVFIMMEMTGEYSENPFEGLYNDVPISAIARSTEIDIRQMLEEEDLPPEIKPVTSYKILY